MSVLLVASSAVVAGACSFTAIGQWARNAPQDTLARLGARTTTAPGPPRRSVSAWHRAQPPSADGLREMSLRPFERPLALLGIS